MVPNPQYPGTHRVSFSRFLWGAQVPTTMESAAGGGGGTDVTMFRGECVLTTERAEQ